MVKGRINFVSDLWTNAAFFFRDPETYDPESRKKTLERRNAPHNG